MFGLTQVPFPSACGATCDDACSAEKRPAPRKYRAAKSLIVSHGEIAQVLYEGGCYTRAEGDGRVENERSLAFCEAFFDLRWAEVSYYSTHSPWTGWFCNISETLDWTAILFDRRARTLSILVTTDTD